MFAWKKLFIAFGFSFRVISVGDVTNASGNESVLREQGVQVEVLEDSMGIELYRAFRAQQPELELEDWKGKR